MNKIEHALKALREALAPQGLFARIDAAECERILDYLEENLPDVLRRADEIVRDRDAVIRRAEDEARRILAEAEDRARRMVSESVVLKRAEEEAKRAEAMARERGERAASDTARVAAETLDGLTSYLDSLSKRTQEYARRVAPAKKYSR